MMRKTLFITALLVTAEVGFGQLSDAELRTIAKDKMNGLGLALADNATVSHKRDTVMGVEGPDYVVVEDDEGMVRLTVQGDFLSYGSLDPGVYSRPDGKPDRFSNDERFGGIWRS